MAGEVERRIGDYVDAHADEMVGFLQKVVQSKSLWGDVPELDKCGDLLAAKMSEAGVRVERPDSGTPGAPNVLGRVGDASTGRRFLLCGHYDVYPPSKAWSFDPWSAPIRDGKVYGPGSTDMKGGTTAMVVAATVLAALGEPKGGEVVVLGVPNHFEGGEGTRRAFDQGLTAEAGIICEPTDLDICAAQRGILYMDITIKGVGAHTTYEAVGVNAIEPVIPIIQALKAPAFAKPEPQRVRAGEDRQHRAGQGRAPALPDPGGMRAHRRRPLRAVDERGGGARRGARHPRRHRQGAEILDCRSSRRRAASGIRGAR